LPPKHINKSGYGFSLIEVVLALAIASFCLLLLMTLLPAGLRTNQETLDESRALQVAGELSLDSETDLNDPNDLLKPPFDSSGNVTVTVGGVVRYFYGYDKTSSKNILASTPANLEEPRFLVDVSYIRVPQKEDADGDGTLDSSSALPVEAVISLYWPVNMVTRGNNNAPAVSITAANLSSAQSLTLYLSYARP
jgi:prepilin-type N-terminal cleavage/methylation domain-containing protein